MKNIDIFIVKKVILYTLLYAFTAGIIISTFFMVHNNYSSYPGLRAFIVLFASILLTKYFFYMTISPWYDVSMEFKDLKRRKSLQVEKYLPKVSVIIPAWNEEVGILATINTLLLSTYKNMEIIIVNDGSTDKSDAILSEFVRKHDAKLLSDPLNKKIIYKYQANGGKGRALNTAIGLSSGSIIVSIDADCAVLPNTVENFVKCFEDKKVMAAVGNVKIGNTRTILGVIQYLEFLFSFYFKKGDSLMNTVYIIGGAAGAFRREVFDKIGYYHTKNITEDIDLSVRIQAAGMKIAYVSDAIVYTEGATDFDGLSSQRLRWKHGRFQTFYEFRYLFFSTDKIHNKILTFLILPFGVFGDVQLSLELLFLIFLYVFSFLVHDFSSFISGIIVVSSMFFVQILFDDKSEHRFSFFLLAPIGWLLFYLTTIVEYNALIKSMWKFIENKDLKWQRWKRHGVIDTANSIEALAKVANTIEK